MSAAQPTASSAPATAPTAVTSRPSIKNSLRTVRIAKPVARRTPISERRCSMLNLKNSAVSKSADTMRKKLKYEKYAPKSVAPAEADRFCDRTSITVSPARTGSTPPTIEVRRAASLSTASADEAVAFEGGCNRSEVTRPYFVCQIRWPTASGTKPLGAVRYVFQ